MHTQATTLRLNKEGGLPQILLLLLLSERPPQTEQLLLQTPEVPPFVTVSLQGNNLSAIT